MLHIVCWKWQHARYRFQYTAAHVNTLHRSLEATCTEPHRFVCVTDDPMGVTCEAHPLWTDYADLPSPRGARFPSCFRRMRVLGREAQAEMGIRPGDHILSLDLDVVITGDIAPLVRDLRAPFTGWIGINPGGKVVYNGTMWAVIAGHPEVEALWSGFSADRMYEPSKHGYFGSDQGWFSYRLAGSAPGWDRPEVLSFSRDVEPLPDCDLPPQTAVVSFNGDVKPWDWIVSRTHPRLYQQWRRFHAE